jgi:hypothetical protein
LTGTRSEAERIRLASRDLRQADVDLGIARNLRVVTNAADPFDSPKKIVLRKVVDCVNGSPTADDNQLCVVPSSEFSALKMTTSDTIRLFQSHDTIGAATTHSNHGFCK